MREMKQTATFNAKHRTYSGVLGSVLFAVV